MPRSSFFSMLALVVGSAGAALAADATPSASQPNQPADSSRISSKTTVERISRLSARESQELSFAAARVLKHVAQARAALAENKPERAQEHVGQGLKLVAIIDRVLPREKMKTSITAGELVYSDEDEFTPEFITVFEELERRDIVTPILQAKQEVAQQIAPKSADGKAPAGEGPLYVSQADINYTSLKLDVDAARRLLREANQALDGKKPRDADLALNHLQTTAVLLEYDELELPLAQAADNLKLAEAEMNTGRYEAAKVALNAAVDELERYEKQTGETPRQGSQRPA